MEKKILASYFYRYFPDSKSKMKSFWIISIFAILQTILLNLNGIIDNFMIGSLYNAENLREHFDWLNPLFTTEDLTAISKAANLANTTALIQVNQWWFISSVLAMGLGGGIVFYIAIYLGRGEEQKVRRSLAMRWQLIFFAILLFSIIVYSSPETMINLFYRKKDIARLSPAELMNLDINQARFYIEGRVTIDVAASYIKIIMISWIIWTFSVTISGIIKDLGKAWLPTISVLVAIGANIGFNLMFIKLDYGVNGTAYSTIISRGINLIIMMTYMFIKFRHYIPRISDFWIDWFFYFKHFLSKWLFSLQTFIWGIFISLEMLIYNVYFKSDYANDVYGAAQILSVSNNFRNVFLAAFDGIAPLISIYVGRELGKGNIEEAKKNSKQILGFGFLVSAIMSVLLVLISIPIPYSQSIFDVPQQVLDRAQYVVLIVAACYPFLVISFSVRSIMSQGSGTTAANVLDLIYTVGMVFIIWLFSFLGGGLELIPEFWIAYIPIIAFSSLKCVPLLILKNKVHWYVPKTQIQANVQATSGEI